MNVHDKIIDLLAQGNFEYKREVHPPVFTSEDAAKIRDEDMSIGAKSLILYADKNPLLIVVPGDRKIDIKKFKNLFNIKDLRFAKPDEVKKLVGIEIGAIPPVGKALGLKSYYDEVFKSKNTVAFNAGEHTISIFMKACDLIKLEQPKFGDFIK